MKIKKIGMQKNGYGALSYGLTGGDPEPPTGALATVAPIVLVTIITLAMASMLSEVLKPSPSKS